MKTLQQIHKAMLAGQLVLLVAALLMVYMDVIKPPLTAYNELLQVIAIALGAVGYFAGAQLFKMKLVAARAITGNTEKAFAVYRSGIILHWALMEMGAISAILCMLLTGNYAFIALGMFILLLFSMLAPSKFKIAIQLQLSEEAVAKL